MKYNVYIRPLREEDALTSYQWRNDPKIWRFTGSRPNRTVTPEMEREWIVSVLRRENEMRFAICLSEDDTYIGNVFFTDIKDGQALMHVFVGEVRFWGKDRAYNACWLALEQVFTQLGLQQVNMEMHKNNPGMAGVIRMGWQQVAGLDNGFVQYKYTREQFEQATKQAATLVSVCILTYNHSKYIRQCLEGVMMQQTSFAFEVIIGEDCSTDDTRSIIKEFELKYPGIIKPVYHEKNVGPQRNAYEYCWPRLTGKYIAVCEGDDYWTDTHKLQKQVDFLEANEDFVLCFHGTRTVNEVGEVLNTEEMKGPVNVFDWKSIFHKHIATMSVVFRNCIPNTHKDFVHVTYGDLFLFTVLSQYGKLAELGFIGGNYRKHAFGLYGGRTMADKYKGTIETRKFMRNSSLFNEDQKKEIVKTIWREKKRYAKNLFRHGDFTSSIKILFL
jgi:glycosyltransferase involved in cell wall biosynthesis/RimJ/RimL family protein N-acetyltransferase